MRRQPLCIYKMTTWLRAMLEADALTQSRASSDECLEPNLMYRLPLNCKACGPLMTTRCTGTALGDLIEQSYAALGPLKSRDRRICSVLFCSVLFCYSNRSGSSCVVAWRWTGEGREERDPWIGLIVCQSYSTAGQRGWSSRRSRTSHAPHF